MVLATLIIHRVAYTAKASRLIQVINALHISLSIGLGLFLLIVLFSSQGTIMNGDRHFVSTVVVGWILEILGILSINEHRKALTTRPTRPVISAPTPVLVEYGHGIPQGSV
ncbi:hypothetical protein B0H14DRAFT_2733853, partial [Mycena olivaceomarginata]